MIDDYCYTVRVGLAGQEQMVFQGDDEVRAKEVYDFYRRGRARVVLLAEAFNPDEHFAPFTYQVYVGPKGQQQCVYEDRNQAEAETECQALRDQGWEAEVIAYPLDDYPFDLREDEREDDV